MTYAGFWRRFGAYLVDFIALIPLIAISVYGTNHSRWFQALWLIPGALIGIWFSVHLVVRYSVLFGLSMLTSGTVVIRKTA